MAEPLNLRFSGGAGETKTFLCFALAEAALVTMLPGGCRIAPPVDPAMQGVNLKVVLSENLVALDPSGRPPVAQRFVALVVDAVREGLAEPSPIVVGSYIPGSAGNDPYGNAGMATISVRRAITSIAAGADAVEESWLVETADGDRLSVALEYARGVPVFSRREFRIASSIDAERWRVYRTEQGEDLVMSRPAGVDRIRSFSFSATGPRLSPLFGGSEKPVAIINVPWGRREIWVE